MSPATTNEPFVFRPSANQPAGTSDIVVDTRREISEIVREVAAAVRSDRSRAEFLALLADRTLRAMAAEGVVIWQRNPDAKRITYRCVHRLGRVTDRTLPDESAGAHQRLLVEIGHDGSPVVVPPTPGAADSDVPANPSDVPVALAPIDCDSTAAGADMILEVFLESGGGVATQRGYLRFVAQMADLAGEFLRADQLRVLRRRQSMASTIDQLTTRIHQILDSAKLNELIVDSAADAFGFDRVGLVRIDGTLSRTKATLIAVSHVHTIDQKSPAAQQLRHAAETKLAADGCQWLDGSADPDAEPKQDSLIVRAVASSRPDANKESSFRLIGLQTADTPAISSESRDQWLRLVVHAGLAIANLETSTSSSWFSVARMIRGEGSASPLRKALKCGAAVATVLVAGMIPVPLTVDAPAIVRPAESQVVCAPRDAVVDSISVTHGDTVTAGQTLLTMSDERLEEQLEVLRSSLRELGEKRARLTEAMMDASSSQLDRAKQTQDERMLVTEEIQSVNDQLNVLLRTQQNLVIRADRDGIVDAWQVESRLQSRPVRRGDGLMRVIASDSAWLVEAHVPQNRIAHLNDPVAHVSFDADPGQVFGAELLQIGPAVISASDPAPATAALLKLGGQEWESSIGRGLQAGHRHSDPSGAPARVMFRCGNRPAAYVAFQDLIHWVSSTTSLYFARETSHSDTDNARD
ncbi:efflux RND transporter periplasmic adaptor subunit [Rubripirellula reticaptiva]|uniref:HlyD family secretion protein n=1 Tax=Rubripirellula reticaptiva TaxID=2528013 RepID=A0A5C6F4D4_9BACT|nr:HlyD family efflux transporter periplasmic adaptor subunit [Rubripirellula reticaptiva]TWU56055.1 HlyD family secretion protein [Rubripirellula reticaptiva]